MRTAGLQAFLLLGGLLSIVDVVTGLRPRPQFQSPPDSRLVYRRQLVNEQLFELNTILNNIEVDLGNLPQKSFKPTEHWLGGNVKLDLSQLKCRNPQLGGVLIDATKPSDREVVVTVTLKQISIVCNCAWQYSYALPGSTWMPGHPESKGTGTASGSAAAHHGNSLSVSASFTSEDLASSLPALKPGEKHLCRLRHRADCNPFCEGGEGDGFFFHLDPLHGTNNQGSVAGFSLDELFHDEIMDAVGSALSSSGAVCDAIGDALPEVLEAAFEEINEELQPVAARVGMPPASVEAMLASERAFGGVDILNLRDEWNGEGNALVGLARSGIERLGASESVGHDTPNCYVDFMGEQRCSRTRPLLLGSLLTLVLEPGGTLQLRAQDIPIDGLSNSMHLPSDLFDIDIQINTLTLQGLDSIRVFEPVRMIGNTTALTTIALDFIGVAVDLNITLVSAGSSGNVVDIGDVVISEQVVLCTGIQRPAITLATMLAVSTPIFSNIALGSVVQDPVGCLLAAVHTNGINLTYLNASFSNISHPQLIGFLDAGTDEIVNGLSDAIFLVYEAIVINGFPGYADTDLRHLLNDEVDSYVTDANHRQCKVPAAANASAPQFLDFREANLTGFLPDWAIQPGRCEPPCTLAWIINEGIGAESLNSAVGEATQAVSGQAGMYSSGTEDGLYSTDFELKADLVHEPNTCMTCARVGKVRIALGNLSLAGINTLATPMALLEPSRTDPYLLHNAISMGGETPLRIAVDVAFSIHGVEDSGGAGITLDDRFTVSLDLHHVQLLLDVLLMVDDLKFWQIPLGRLMESSAYLETLAAARPTQFNFEADTAVLRLACTYCTSPLLLALAENLRKGISSDEITTKFNSVLKTFAEHFVHNPSVQRQYQVELQQYSTAATQHNLEHEICVSGTDTTTARCDLLSKLLQCQTQSNAAWMAEHCAVSCGSCPDLPVNGINQEEDKQADEIVMDTVGWLMLLGGVLMGLLCLAVLCSKKSSRSAVNTTLLVDTSRVSSQLSSKTNGGNQLTQLWTPITDPNYGSRHSECSLAKSPYLPRWLRLVVFPTALVCNIALFVSGHLSIGSTVDARVELMGQHVRTDRFVEFSLGHSLIDLWHANAMTLFWLVGGFSGVWPYLKLLVIVFCWVAPPSWCSPVYRETILLRCEAAGTWSFMDMYLLVMCMLGFSTHIENPRNFAFIPDGFYVFDAILTPVWGLYAFVMGIMLSILLNYIAVQAHRRAVLYAEAAVAPGSAALIYFPAATGGEGDEEREQEQEQNDQVRVALCAQSFEAPFASSSDLSFLSETPNGSYGCTRVGRATVAIMLGGAAVLIVIGAMVPSFEFQLFGIAGLLVDFGTPGAATKRFSLLSSTAALLAQAPSRYGGSIGIVFLAMVYVSFAFLVPLAILAIAAVQWLIPLTLNRQRQLETVSEALRAWSALPVFVMSIAISMVQIEQVSGYVVGKPCQKLGDVFTQADAFALLDSQFFPEEMQESRYCFVVRALNLGGLWWLIAGWGLSIIACRIVSALSLEAIAKDHTVANARRAGAPPPSVLLYPRRVDSQGHWWSYTAIWQRVAVHLRLCIPQQRPLLQLDALSGGNASSTNQHSGGALLSRWYGDSVNDSIDAAPVLSSAPTPLTPVTPPTPALTRAAAPSPAPAPTPAPLRSSNASPALATPIPLNQDVGTPAFQRMVAVGNFQSLE